MKNQLLPFQRCKNLFSRFQSLHLNFNLEVLVEASCIVSFWLIFLVPRVIYLSNLPDLTLNWYYQSYYHVGMAKMWLLKHWKPGLDLSYGGTPYTYPPLYHVILAAISFLTGVQVELVARYLAPLIGSTSFITFYLVVREVLGSRVKAFLSSSFANFTFSVVNETYYMAPISMGIPLVFFGVYSAMKSYKKGFKWLLLLSAATAAISFLDALALEVYLFFLLPILLLDRGNENFSRVFKAIFISISPAFLYYSILFILHGPANSLFSILGDKPSLESIRYEYTDYFIALSTLGFPGLFNLKRKQLLTILSWIFISLFLVFGQYLKPYIFIPLEWWRYTSFLCFPLSIPFGHTFIDILSPIGRKPLFALTLIFTVSFGLKFIYLPALKSADPLHGLLLTEEEIKALDWLNRYTNMEDMVLGDHVFSEAVIGRAARKVMYGGNWDMCRDYDQRVWDAERIYFLLNSTQSYMLCLKYNVTVVVVSERIINGPFWVVPPYRFEGKSYSSLSYSMGPRKFEDNKYWLKVYEDRDLQIFRVKR